ncbi:MAG: orotate phosphoribosyltransferase [Actinomycetota bacterium]|nr:orotate phosphoribosyltransferase [Actinomycetota bacterium]
MNAAEVTEVLEKRGAVLRGHFRLSSGLHSDVFVQKFRIFEDPRLTQRFGEEIANLFDGDFDTVASPALGAIALGFATGLAADTRFVFAERVDGRLSFRRGFALSPRERTLVVEDVVTTGGSAAEVVDLVRASGADPVGVGVLLDRSGQEGPPDLGAPLRALVQLDAPTWTEEACPLCRDSVPLDDPGSRRL